MTRGNWFAFVGSLLVGSLLEFVLCIPNWPFPSLSHAILLQSLLQAVSPTHLTAEIIFSLAEHPRGMKSRCIAGISWHNIVILLSCLGVCEDHFHSLLKAHLQAEKTMESAGLRPGRTRAAFASIWQIWELIVECRLGEAWSENERKKGRHNCTGGGIHLRRKVPFKKRKRQRVELKEHGKWEKEWCRARENEQESWSEGKLRSCEWLGKSNS